MASTEVVASSAILVHPLDEALADFYARKAGFVRCPDLSPLTMMLSLRQGATSGQAKAHDLGTAYRPAADTQSPGASSAG